MTVGTSLLLLSALAATGLPSTAADLDPANCARAAAYSRQHGGEVLRIEQAGRVIYQDVAPDADADAPRKIYSGTKSLIAVTALILAQQGKLRLDERASDTLTEWKNDARRTITLDQLLSQTSGLDPDGDPIYSARDQLAAAVRMPLVSPPGTRFHYGAAGYQAFGEILRRKFHKSVEDIVTDTLLDPYDLDVASWKRDDAGNVLVHAGMEMTAKAWARFGELLLRPVLTPDDSRPALGYPQLFLGHAANPAYGLGFWLNAPQPPDARQSITDLQPAIDGEQLYPGGPPDLIAAIGTGKQRLYVIPSLRLVVVRFGHEAPFSDGDFLSRLLTGRPHPDRRTH
jgi:CubicO group peptidase (beta-lactamase class C family)